MRSVKPKEGSLLRVDLPDSVCAYARVLGQSQVAVYAIHTKADESLASYDDVYRSNILFVVTVRKTAWSRSNWKVVDVRALESSLLAPRKYFLKDKASGKFFVYSSHDGSQVPASFEECQSLEAAAVWEPSHIEERISDAIAGRPSLLVDRLKAAI